MLAAGIGRDWPRGRGLFRSHDEVLSAWVNEEDHLRVVTICAGADVTGTVREIRQFIAQLTELLEFARDPRLG